MWNCVNRIIIAGDMPVRSRHLKSLFTRQLREIRNKILAGEEMTLRKTFTMTLRSTQILQPCQSMPMHRFMVWSQYSIIQFLLATVTMLIPHDKNNVHAIQLEVAFLFI
jgi:hypothetical protein